MFFKEPKNTKDFYWTRHIRGKMIYYGLGEGRLRRILKNPKRKEEGIAPNTVALMQPASPTGRRTGSKKPGEIWLMYQPASSVDKQKRNIMISAWRYPGISPKRKEIPIPDDIIKELKKEGIIK